MIELQQFLLWLVRKSFSAIMAAPYRWHNQLTNTFNSGDWFIPLILIFIGISLAGLGAGLMLTALGQSHTGATVMLTMWGIGLLFVVSAAIRAMYRVFKQEQQDLIKALKQ